MHFGALRQESLAPALAPPRECGAPAFGLHARTKTVLAFARAFRGLERPFHFRAKERLR